MRHSNSQRDTHESVAKYIHFHPVDVEARDGDHTLRMLQ